MLSDQRIEFTYRKRSILKFYPVIFKGEYMMADSALESIIFFAEAVFTITQRA